MERMTAIDMQMAKAKAGEAVETRNMGEFLRDIETYGLREQLAVACCGAGEVFLATNDLERARSYFRQSIRLSEASNDVFTMVLAACQIVPYLLRYDEHKDKAYCVMKRIIYVTKGRLQEIPT